MTDPSHQDSAQSKRFKVALSFPGEHRGYVSEVAAILAEQLGTGAILYDRYLTAELARPNLGFYLPKLYQTESELIVVFLCGEYQLKEWCGLEWRVVYDLIKRRHEADVMLFRTGDESIDGVLSIDGYVPMDHCTPQEAASLILERRTIKAGQGTTMSKVPDGLARATAVHSLPSRADGGAAHPWWNAEVVDDSGTTSPTWELHVEYPSFAASDCEPINAIERGAALAEVAAFRANLPDGWYQPGMPFSILTAAFGVLHYSESLVSLRHTYWRYRNGGAHGGHSTVTRTFARNPVRLLGLDHMFTDVAAALVSVSRYSAAALRLVLPDVASEWISEGTAPSAEKYRRRNPTPAGILVTFDEYEVGPFGVGRQEVLVPHQIFAEWSTPLLNDVRSSGQPGYWRER